MYTAHFVLPTQYQKENHVIIILYLVIIHGRRRLRRHRLWFKLFWMDLLSMGPVRLLYRHRSITITFLYCISVHALYSDNYSDLFHLNDAFKRSFLERFKVILIQMDL